jgi:hypothetical protein
MELKVVFQDILHAAHCFGLAEMEMCTEFARAGRKLPLKTPWKIH